MNIFEFCENTDISCYCEECDIFFCDHCFTSNHKPKSRKSHKKRDKSFESTKKCLVHNQPFELFCMEENRQLCIKCGLSNHKNHHLVTIEEAKELIKTDLKESNFDEFAIGTKKQINNIDNQMKKLELEKERITKKNRRTKQRKRRIFLNDGRNK